MFFKFNGDISKLDLPQKFTFPFYYDPHPLALLAAKELQEYLIAQVDFQHNFGFDKALEGIPIGKMFGVLVVRNTDGDLGYLRAFSGKLAESNHHEGFVPPVFDILTEKGFFRAEEQVLNKLNREVEEMESNEAHKVADLNLTVVREKSQLHIGEERQKLKEGKQKRKEIRSEAKINLAEHEYQMLVMRLKNESIAHNYKLRDLSKYWKKRIKETEDELNLFTDKLDKLKTKRKMKSAALQDRLFDNYTFLDANLKSKSLLDLFQQSPTGRPPAGAGECAAPKLLQFAFENKYEPVALAEFWWGSSPSAEVRKSGYFYPACLGKCKPILKHMLSQTTIDPNPLENIPSAGVHIPILFEDKHICIINKPHEFLSVPGKKINDSVQSRMKIKYPNASGPLVVHRLDMSTSGLMVIAKNIEAYRNLQRQFTARKVYKRYVAILNGVLEANEGSVELPLRGDLHDRPRQLVCNEHGKQATTKWQKIEEIDGKTRVHFFPRTGRTHQLRVHAAHQLGLNSPIVGDDLYGIKSSRLCLHAEELHFLHPTNKEEMCFVAKAPF